MYFVCQTFVFVLHLWVFYDTFVNVDVAYTDRATIFLGANVISTDSIPNIFPEIAQREDYVFLLSFVIVGSRWSMLSNHVN